MSGWSFSIGKIFDVELRLHSFFLFLLFLSATWAAYLGRPLLRGFLLWMLLLMALAVREVARALAAAWFGIEVKGILLLPTGGILKYETAEAAARAGETRVQWGMALVGPVASVVFGMAIAALVWTVAPGVDLVGVPWVTPEHLLRTMVWVNLLLGAVNLLPAWPLDGGRLMKGEMTRGGGMGAGSPRRRLLLNLSPAIAVGLVVAGVMAQNWWVIMAGIAILLGAQVERQGLLLDSGSDTVRVRDVMLTEYSILSASATLEDAVEQARHTLQDVFPVVRAGNMVGAVARQSVLEALATTGNGYVQGIMLRTIQTAVPEESLVAALGKVRELPGMSSQMVVVLNEAGGEQVLGIITPQNLQRSMGMLARTAQAAGRRTAEDEME